eukprot:Opistho-2@50616
MVPVPHSPAAMVQLGEGDSHAMKSLDDLIARLGNDVTGTMIGSNLAGIQACVDGLRQLMGAVLSEKAVIAVENAHLRDEVVALRNENLRQRSEIESLRNSHRSDAQHQQQQQVHLQQGSSSVGQVDCVGAILSEVSEKARMRPDSKIVLITGAAGFIGFHTALRLVARGDIVVGLDNYNDYYDVQLKKDRAAILADNGIEIIDGDICDMDLVRRILSSAKVTNVIHLAAQAGVRFAVEKPLTYIRSNVQGFVTLLESVRLENQSTGRDIKVAYASSSSVYGLNTKTPFAETDVVDRPASLYGATKKSNEEIAHAYNHVHGLAVTGLRFFTVYGPYGRPDMAIYSFTKDIIAGKTLTVFRNHDGSELLRDFTYVDDIVTGILGAVDLGARCDIFNLGNSAPETVSQFIGHIESSTGKEAKVQYKTVYGGDVSVTYADVTKAKKLLGYVPTTSLSDGVRKFVAWFTEYHGASSSESPRPSL